MLPANNVINTGNLPDFVIEIFGDSNFDGFSGFSVSGAGDFNGDGVDDLVLGSPQSFTTTSSTLAGRAYVVYGSAGLDSVIEVEDHVGSEGFEIISSETNNLFGWSVSSAGDVNSDGLDDLVIGSPKSSMDHNAYVIYGKIGGSFETVYIDQLTASDGFVILEGQLAERAGFSVSSLGDVNADGIDDLILGAPEGRYGGSYAGQAYVVYGSAGTARDQVDLDGLRSRDGFIVQGDDGSDQTGISVSNAGDVNGDGIQDILLGAEFGNSITGSAYVIYGVPGTDRNLVDLTGLSSADGFALLGDGPQDRAGHSVSSAGDVNGDGIDDLIIGAYANDDGGVDAGKAYVVYGKAIQERSNLELSNLNVVDGYAIQGNTVFDQFGYSVSSAGDINGDGLADLIVGAPMRSGSDTRAGEAYVIFGQTGLNRGLIDTTNLNPADGFKIVGNQGRQLLGQSVSDAGDVNDDGYDDVIIGAPVSDGIDGFSFAGRSYVVLGFAGTQGQVFEGKASDDIYVGDEGSDAVSGFAGANSLVGDLGHDILIGGIDDDILDGDIGNDILIGDNNAQIAGADRLIGGVGDDLLEGGAGADVFVFKTNEGDDVIGQIAVDYSDLRRSEVVGRDFTNGVDQVSLTGFGFADGTEALANLTDIDGVATFRSHGTEITFAGLTSADFSADDFLIF